MDHGNFQIDQANPADFQRLTEIAVLSKSSLGYPADVIRAWLPELEVTPEMIAHWISYVAKKDQQIVGFWCREPVEHLSEGRLFVRPEFQGQGCGRLLWAAVVGEAKRRGLRKMSWEADFNVLEFYQKMGARLIRTTQSAVVPGLQLPIIEVTLDG